MAQAQNYHLVDERLCLHDRSHTQSFGLSNNFMLVRGPLWILYTLGAMNGNGYSNAMIILFLNLHKRGEYLPSLRGSDGRLSQWTRASVAITSLTQNKYLCI